MNTDPTEIWMILDRLVDADTAPSPERQLAEACATAGLSSELRHDDISDVEIDLDEGLLILHKRGIGRPTWIRTRHPYLLGRKLEILREKL